MRRLLFPMTVALVIHGFLLSLEGKWLKQSPFQMPRPIPVSLELGYFHPQEPTLHDKWLRAPSGPPLRSLHSQHKAVPLPKKLKWKQNSQNSIVIAKQTIDPQVLRVLRKVDQLPKQINPAHSKAKKKILSKLVSDHAPTLSSLSSHSLLEKQTKKPSDQGPDRKTSDYPERPLSGKKVLASLTSTQNIREAIPFYRKNPPPEYPRIARRRGYQGTVVLEVLVNREGTVRDLRIYRSSGHTVLDKAAVASVRHWFFEPGKRGDEKVKMWVKVPIRFQLKK